jgi:DNA gyrase/topoisomerase IV subunit A
MSLVLLPSVDDGLDDLERRLVRGLADGGAVRPAPHRKTTRLLALAVGEQPPRDEETLARMREWLAGDDPELRAAATAVMAVRPIDEELVAAGRAWRSIDDPVAAAYARVADLGLRFRSRVPLVDLNGCWGSEDGDPPADHLYTECRLSPWGAAVLEGTAPNLLVNGSVARDRPRAVHFLPHEPGEVARALSARLAGDVPAPLAPDFPTGGIVADEHAWQAIARDGRGSLRVRARMRAEEHDGSPLLVATEMPFLVDRCEPIAEAATCLRDGRLHGVRDVRDETSRAGARLVFVLAAGADPGAVAGALLAHTSLEVTIDVDGMAMVDGAPRLVTEAELAGRTASRLLARARDRMPAARPEALRGAVERDLQALVEAHAGGRRTGGDGDRFSGTCR